MDDVINIINVPQDAKRSKSFTTKLAQNGNEMLDARGQL